MLEKELFFCDGMALNNFAGEGDWPLSKDEKEPKMGGTTFMTVGKGKNAREAFRAARENAQHEYGHGGYTGTIAEKHDFTLMTLPDGERPMEWAWKKLDQGMFADKWGPAGCVKISDEEYLFFGWASS